MRFCFDLFLSSLSGGSGSSQGKTVVRESKSSIAWCSRELERLRLTEGQDRLTVSMRVGHWGGDVLGRSGHQDIVAVVCLLQLNQLGVGGGGGIHGLEGGGLVVDGLLSHGGDGMDSVGVGEASIATIQQLGGGLDRDGEDRENNLRDKKRR